MEENLPRTEEDAGEEVANIDTRLVLRGTREEDADLVEGHVEDDTGNIYHNNGLDDETQHKWEKELTSYAKDVSLPLATTKQEEKTHLHGQRLELFVEQGKILTEEDQRNIPLLEQRANTLIVPLAIENIETVWEWLNDEDVGTIQIFGEPGMGKTWTARHVMARALAVNNFDVVIWVDVGSDNRSIAGMQKQIVCQLKLVGTFEFEQEEEEATTAERTQMIFFSLEMKRYLLILDDLLYSSSYDLDALGVPHPKDQNKSSSVLFTNWELDIVATDKVLKLEKLSQDEALLLFEKITSFDINSPDILELAQPLLKKCNGVSYEIFILAGTLRRDLGEPHNSLKSMANLQKAYDLAIDRSLSHIEFICEMLSNKNVRDCFLYCTSVPDSHHFSVKGVITSWIVEGFLDGFSCLEKAYEKGHDILMELMGRYLLSIYDDKHASVYTRLRMEAVSYRWSRGLDLGMHSKSVLVDGIISNRKSITLMNEKLQTKYPEDARGPLYESSTLLLYGREGCLPREVPDVFFEQMQQLQILALVHIRIRSLPTSLLNLKDLKVLVVRGCGKLQNVNRIRQLSSLKILGLSGAVKLKKLQDDFFELMGGLEYLNLSHSQLKQLPSSFSNLCKIRTLILRGSSHLETLPSLERYDLGLLDLSGACVLKKFPQKFGHSPIMLDLSGTLVEKIPYASDLVNPLYLILRGCSLIKTMPHPDTFDKLKVLDLSGATAFRTFHGKTSGTNYSLVKLDLSETQIVQVQFLSRCVELRQLLLTTCSNLRAMPSLSRTRKLEVLDLSGSISFKKFQDEIFGDQLLYLDLSRTQIEKLPRFSGKANLIQLLLKECECIEEIPHLELQKLEVLDLSGSTKFKKFNNGSFKKLSHLQTLDLSATQVTKLPALSECSHLRQLVLRKCSRLETLPLAKTLEVLDLSGAITFKHLQDDSLGDKCELKRLNLSGTQVVQLSLSKFHNLSELILRGCSKLEKLQNLETLSRLELLDLSGAVSFTNFEDHSFGHMHDLHIIDLSETPIVELPLSGCMNLRQLLLRDCPNLKKIPPLQEFAKLEVLDLSGRKDLEFSVLSGCSKLCQLSVRGCTNLETLSFEGMHNLQKVDLSETPITMLPSCFSDYRNLCQLLLKGCSSLVMLPHSDLLNKLEVLDISCKRIKEISEGVSECTQFRFLITLNRKYIWEFEMEETFQRFHFCLFSCKEQIKERDIYLHGQGFIFRDIYYQTNHLPQWTEEPDNFFKICGFKTFPAGIEEVLTHVELLYVKNNDFLTRLSDLGAENVKVMRECWIESCGRMESVFYGEEEEENVSLGRCLQNLWVSRLSELKCLFKRVMLSGSFSCLRHIYLDCCPSLITVFSSHMELKNLETLQIKFCDKLVNIFGETVSGEDAFPKVNTLTLWNLPKLQCICRGVLPSLKKLGVKGCPKLQKLPVVVNSGSPPIYIKGELVWWESLKWDEKGIKSHSHLHFTQLPRIL